MKAFDFIYQSRISALLKRAPLGEMIKGPFKYLKHNHRFITNEDHSTLMIDEFYFQSPFGFLGKVVDQFLLKFYLKRLLLNRNGTIKAFAESERWQQLLKA